MPFIVRLGTQDVAVPAGQSIIVGCANGTAKVYYGNAAVGGVYIYVLQSLVTGVSTFGPFASGQQVRIEAPNGAEVEYVTGAAPQLTAVNPGDMPTITMGAGQFLYESASNAITAFAGGGQASAVALTSQTNRVTTVATAGDSVKLPAAVAGLELTVINRGANDMAVFPSTGDAIDGQAANTSVLQMPNSVVLYFCSIAGQWESEGLASGFGGPGLATQSAQDGLTAKAGGGQGGGPTINRMINRVTTVATAADSITLPVSARGLTITIVNAAAANSMNVFPNTGDAINALAANAAYALAAGKTATFYCTAAGQWHTVLSA